MKTCPYCGRKFPDSKDRCPACGAPYWEAGREDLSNGHPSPDDDQGCLSIIVIQLLTALGLAAFLIVLGFMVNLVVHFEANQVKILWIGASLFLGVLLSLIIKKIRRTRKRKKRSQASRTRGKDQESGS